MPRPGSETETPVGAGFGPSATPTTQLGNYAPLNVQGAPSQAALLAKSLGVVTGEVDTALVRKARLQGAADEGQGGAAAATGSIDPALMAKNAGYAVGAQRVSAQGSAISAIESIRKQMDTDPKYASLDPESASVAADGLLKQQLGGLDENPVTAKAILPMVQAFHNSFFSARTEETIRNTQASSVANAQALAAAQVSLPPGSPPVFTYADQLGIFKGLYGGNGAAAQMNLSQVLIDTAVAKHNPDILSLIQPPPGAPGLAPDLQLRINEAQQRIKILQQSDNEAWNKKAQLPIMDAALSGKDPTAMLHDYLSHPGADPQFASQAMEFFHRQATDSASDQLDSGTAAEVVAGVAGGKYTTAEQVLGAVNAAGVRGKAQSQLLDKALSTLRSVQSTDTDDPSFRAGVSHLQELYRPGQNSLTGQIQNPAQLNQQTGIVMDYRTEYAAAIKHGQSAEMASSTALQSVQKKWGDPLEQGMNFKNRKLPQDDVDQAAVVRAATTDTAHFRQSGIRADDIKRLADMGLVSPAEAAGAYQTIISMHNR